MCWCNYEENLFTSKSEQGLGFDCDYSLIHKFCYYLYFHFQIWRIRLPHLLLSHSLFVCPRRFVHGTCDADADLKAHQLRKDANPDYEYTCPNCKNGQISAKRNSIEDSMIDSNLSASQESLYLNEDEYEFVYDKVRQNLSCFFLKCSLCLRCLVHWGKEKKVSLLIVDWSFSYNRIATLFHDSLQELPLTFCWSYQTGSLLTQLLLYTFICQNLVLESKI